MSPQLLLIDNVGMTAFARLVTGVGDGTGGNFGDRVAPVVAVLSERTGDDGSTESCKRNQSDQHDGGKANEVFYVFEQSLTFGARLQGARSCAKKRNDLRYRELIGRTMIEVTTDCDGGHRWGQKRRQFEPGPSGGEQMRPS